MFISIGAFLTAGAMSSAEAAGEPRLGTPMRHLLKQFRTAKSPSSGHLLGRWVQIRSISTERFLTGMEGPDHLSFEPAGLRRETESGRPLEWTLVISKTDDELTLKSNPFWSKERESPLRIDRGADLLIDAQFDADTEEGYRCRLSETGNLVCLLDRHEYGNGVEFRKMGK
ncbi:MAG: hypothetical protein QOK37_4607 [Thermoanaerobaculia bacterium]|jgi:hypothetical protein|nr:hypothetical protein [Thermoanaerobaculia bacterium]